MVWVCGWYRCWWRPACVYPAPLRLLPPRLGLAALVVVNPTSGGGLIPASQCIGRDRGGLTNRSNAFQVIPRNPTLLDFISFFVPGKPLGTVL